MYEIIGGAIGGLLVIIILILVFLLLRKRNNDKSPVQENLVETTTSLNGVQFGSKPGQLDKDEQEENTPKETKETDSLILGKYYYFPNLINDTYYLVTYKIVQSGKLSSSISNISKLL